MERNTSKLLRATLLLVSSVGFLWICGVAIKHNSQRMELVDRIRQHESYAEAGLNRCISGYINYYEIENHREEIRKCLEKNMEKSHPFSIWCENISILTSPEIGDMMIRNRVLFSDQLITIVDVNDSNRFLVRKKVLRNFQDRKVSLIFEFVFDRVNGVSPRIY
jgi:hypothetical protein